MARLLVVTPGLERQTIDLKIGSNIIGRSPDTDFSLTHPTISTMHCEMVLSDSGVILRDLESTNGTFINNEPVREAVLAPGQMVRLGDVELSVESVDVKIAIPILVNTELPAPPVVSIEGGLVCPRHSRSAATYQCTSCQEVMCVSCVHRLRRKGGKNTLLLCPICSNAVKLIGEPDKPKKRSLFARVGETVKLKLTRTMRTDK